MGKFAAGLCLAAILCVLPGAEGAAAQELDFPSAADGTYSLKDRSDFVCLRDNRIRVIYVNYLEVEGEPPCTVVYEKNPPEESSSQVLWRADTKQGFCEAQAKDLVQKLRRAEWRCGLLIDVMEAEE